MFGHLKFIWLVLLALILTGCKTITIDESYVFQPGQFGGNETGPRTSKMKYEEIFQQPSNIVIDVWANKEKAKHIIRPEDFVKTSITHDILEAGNERLGITLVERAGAARPLVVHCGGNASDRYESGTLYAQKIIASADVLMFDYPGYGESTGLATTETLQAANKTIADFAISKLEAGQDLILWGHSLGGFVCAEMVQNFRKVDGIVLETSAANAEEVTDAAVPWFAKPFIKTRVTDSLLAYDTVETLRAFEAPILVLGAAKDRILPVKLSRNLSERLTAAGRDVTYVEFPEGNHISVPTEDRYVATIESFMAKISAAGLQTAQLESFSLNP